MKTRSVTYRKFLSLSTSLFLAGITFFTSPLYANPEGGVVTAGNATISQSGNQTTINQTSDKAVINWQGFSVGTNETTQFVQPAASSVALNRVVGPNSSAIMGQLKANGQVWIVNPAGIFFGPSSSVNVSSLLATTANITDSDFMSGNYHFTQDPTKNASVINQGRIQAADGGFVALVAPGVVNSGIIQAHLGKVALASGNEYTVDLSGDQLINFAVANKVTQTPVDQNGNPLPDAVANHGSIIADGGVIVMSANVAHDVVKNVINMDGIAQANSASVDKSGTIILAGGDDGDVQVAGKVSAAGKTSGTHGGTVKVLGANITLTSNANIDVSGDVGGGTILVGGNARGQGPEMNATTVTINNGAQLNASAITNGDGGKVVVWSNDYTNYLGNIVANGGLLSGNGGNAEVSGGVLSFQGTVNLLAPDGTTGTLLLDPENLTIQTTGPTTATASGSPTNTYTATTDNSILTVANLQTALASASVTVSTGTSGSQSGDITVANSISWTSGNSLTLSAFRNINLNSGTVISNTGGGSVTLRADATATGTGTVTGTGTINLTGGGQVKIFYNPSSYSSPTDFSGNVTSGTLTAYMLVNNATDLQNISNNLGGTYALGTNITMSGNFTPLGDGGTQFTGIFEGNNQTISNLTSNFAADDIGLFGETSGATIQDFTLANENISGNNFVGGVVGAMLGGTITNVNTNGTITGNGNSVGGMAGFNSGNITNSFNTAAVSGSGGLVGGIAGDNEGGHFDTVYNTGNITSSGANVGGIAGQSESNTTINNVYNTGTVTGSDDVGGIVGTEGSGGLDNSSIHTSYNIGTISGSDAGGLVGIMQGTGVTVSNSYNLGKVTGNSNIGGAVGTYSSNGTSTDLYSVGAVIGTSNVGGLVGTINNPARVTNSFWDTDTSGQSSSAAGTGETDTQMKTQSTFTGAGWNFSSTWNSIDGTSYPYLRVFYASTPQIIEGQVFTDQGVTPADSNNSIAVAYNGANLTGGVMSTFANGGYYFTFTAGTITTGNPLLIYTQSGSTVSSTLVDLINSNTNTNLNLYGNTFIARSDTGSAISTTNISAARGSISDAGILYSASGSNITVNSDFITWAANNTSYSVNGNVTASGGMTFNGAVTSAATASLSAGGAVNFNNAVTLGAGTLTVGGSSINFNSTVDGANNLTLNATGNVNFAGVVGGHTALNNVNATASNILGSINANSATLFGTQNLTTNVTVNSLTLGGNNGGTLTGTVNGQSIPSGSFWTTSDGVTLLSGSTGTFSINNIMVTNITNTSNLPSVIYYFTPQTGTNATPEDYQADETPVEVTARTDVTIDTSSTDMLAAANVCR